MDNVEKSTPNKGYVKIAIVIALCMAIIITSIVVYTNNRWKYELDVVYVGYDDGYEYTITNKANRTLEDVTIIFKVDNVGSSDFEFDDWVGTLHVGETKTVKLYSSTLKSEAEERDIELIFCEVDISRITYE